MRRTARSSCSTDELAGPNGLAFSPDERWLYVGNWDFEREGRHALRRPTTGDGLGLLRHDRRRTREDAIDGIKVDRDGNLYVCGPGGIWVLSPAGEHLGTLRLPEAPHNLAWGDDDGRTLYVTALTERLPPAPRDPGHPPRAERSDAMSKIKVGAALPDFELPDENGELHRLSELQGDDAMVLMLGRGEHCPRERQHQREMLKLYEWCSVAFTQLVTVLPERPARRLTS